MTGASRASGAAEAADAADAAEAAEVWERLLGIRSEAEAVAAGLLRTGESSSGARLLVDRYLPLCLAGPYVTFAQLGQSLDGFIATRTGDADYVTGEEDRDHLHRLRALADAVVVGAGTAVSDDPQLTVRTCPGTNPVRVVIDPRGRVPLDCRVFTDGSAPTLWVVGPGREDGQAVPGRVGDGVEVLTLPDREAFAPRALVRTLARRGLGRVLVEGGGVTVSRFLHERALHRLYVTVAPVLLGDGVPGIRFDGPEVMREALRPPVRRSAVGEDTLFELDLRASVLEVDLAGAVFERGGGLAGSGFEPGLAGSGSGSGSAFEEGVTGSVAEGSVPEAVVGPGVTGSVVGPGVAGFAVGPGVTGSVVEESLTRSVAEEGITGSAVGPGRLTPSAPGRPLDGEDHDPRQARGEGEDSVHDRDGQPQ
ncbi:RibD family protein [Streptomyces sp. SID1121]|uniref:RibD family protein n=1 Tax=Streptomyces sp. SID1121 TaxID=3425888 RepID=UPI004056CF81